VPDTGQTLCWDEDGNSRPCAGTGEDGEFQAGVAWPTPRFTDNGDGTVTDNLTGLIWLKDANCPATKTWQEALDWVASFNTTPIACTEYAARTFTDWRLPNVRELQSLVDYRFYNPSLSNTAGTGQWAEGDPFWGVVQEDSHWSSTTFPAFYFDSAWAMLIHYGDAGLTSKNLTKSVWPVRGGQ
jgi:hypothetical protein